MQPKVLLGIKALPIPERNCENLLGVWLIIEQYDIRIERFSPFSTGGKMPPSPRVFAKYLKNGLTDLYQTF